MTISTTTIVLVPAPVHNVLAPLVPAGVSVLPYDEDPSVPLPDGAKTAQAVFRWVAGKRYERLVVDTPSVRWLHTASAGVDHVLTPALRTRGNFTLTDSGPAFAISIGEFVLAQMLSVAHRLPDLAVQQREKRWQWLTQNELHGQTIGIIGLGPIGQGIAARCSAMGMRVVGFRKQDEPVPHVSDVRTGTEGLHALLRESDWVVVAAALTDQSRHLLGRGEIALIKPSAHLINIARGGLIDEVALIEALQTGRIAGACLDVFEKEPLPADSPLWEMPNVWVSPHNAPGWTSGLRTRQIALFVDNLYRFVAGEPLEGVVDVERGY